MGRHLPRAKREVKYVDGWTTGGMVQNLRTCPWVFIGVCWVRLASRCFDVEAPREFGGVLYVVFRHGATITMLRGIHNGAGYNEIRRVRPLVLFLVLLLFRKLDNNGIACEPRTMDQVIGGTSSFRNRAPESRDYIRITSQIPRKCDNSEPNNS